MASNDLEEELLCSICLQIYTDPITLRCGHNFCRNCIDQFLDTQHESGVYSCPECRVKFHDRPVLIRNITLHNVAERLQSSQPPQEEATGICCTFCVDSPVPAVKSCLHCETSLCENHLRVHSKEPEHVLTDPSTSLEKRKCSVHKEVLKYYCPKDAICICVSCGLAGEHRGHQVEMLDEASEKKMKKLRNVLQILTTKWIQSKYRVQSLEERWKRAQEKAAGEVERVTAVFIDMRRRLDDLEKKVLSEISRQEEQISLSLSALIQNLEIKKDELSRKMRHIEELCNMTDPLTVLQDPDTGDLCDPEEGGGDEDTGGHDQTHDVDGDLIIRMIHAGFSVIMTYLPTISPAKPKEMPPKSPKARTLPKKTQVLRLPSTKYVPSIKYVNLGIKGVGGKVSAAGDGGIYGQGPADISLDVNTAGNNDNQVISRRRFSSGRHYWDVEISKSGWWRVGMCYSSMDRRGGEPVIGDNKKSWSLCKRLRFFVTHYSVRHDGKETQLPHQVSSDRVRICLDYGAGQLSFYELCDPIRHLHTFTTTFTEPLHAAVCIWEGSIKISGGEEQL
ncbi:E3 ubiquitin/ISG15 ligase TRIM25-like [Hyla sarda]|uniref:E3 ubiquitin/ISG15 ligase TRIM25-like n=1 Tax=Hyla sarda TaxID=327740 RepID=UPI0024C21459|nr:E3 ubiquitin/ISG15 ligase TRIM25-like [Hyla sarda]